MAEKKEMNKKGKIIAFIWIFLGALFILTLFSLIDPLKEQLDNAVGVEGLDCSTPTEGKRGSCIVVKGALLIFVLGIGYYIVTGVINKLR